ncbi:MULTISPECIES: hypothetical protein [unclassified Pseudonocardia]|uniref:hypothetical protein n=1 Tax=unclassified Pseudonocardia TaxID=2619320 RepID=UPI00094B4199|nr:MULTISPECIES: hypothetical protein [unclassified Pseudonocardia]
MPGRLVVVLQRADHGGVGIGPEAALGRVLLGEDVLPGLGVLSPGPAPREPADGAERLDVGVVALAEFLAQLCDLGGVVGGGGFGVEQGSGGVPEPDEGAELGLLGAGNGVSHDRAALGPGEGPVRCGLEESFLLFLCARGEGDHRVEGVGVGGARVVEPCRGGALDEPLECPGQGGGVAQVVDNLQFVLPVGAVPEQQGPEDHLGVLLEVAVDRDLALVVPDPHRAGVEPVEVGRRRVGFAAPQDEQVSYHCGSRGALVRLAR